MTIDIVMPFYGDPALFRIAVESVLSQADPDWRLVVIDDRYPDPAPGEWLLSLGDERIVYIRNEENLGVGANFQKSVELATADHVTIMGCDDVMLPNYVRRMHRLFADHPDAAYAQPGVTVIGAGGEHVDPLPDRVKRHYAPAPAGVTALSGEALATSIVRGNWTYFPSICWSRGTLVRHGFRIELGVALDLDLQLRIIGDGGSVVVDPEISFAYRRHSGSVSAWTANDGTRFQEEKAVLVAAGSAAAARGWRSTERAARWRVSSRLSAASRLPAALRSRDGRGITTLLAHLFG